MSRGIIGIDDQGKPTKRQLDGLYFLNKEIGIDLCLLLSYKKKNSCRKGAKERTTITTLENLGREVYDYRLLQHQLPTPKNHIFREQNFF